MEGVFVYFQDIDVMLWEVQIGILQEVKEVLKYQMDELVVVGEEGEVKYEVDG